ncbi:aryl-sulfate sulfotransferase [Chakrabartyella piscis]|uniref:aryl-sulfate sulfotransferase n=1 Tax=Chakrabartyella piscis TaxID=2918914 RepID=UPI002958A290|nr:aryl-sulfate sulfotransferase [Chakrabartyella piscis]
MTKQKRILTAITGILVLFAMTSCTTSQPIEEVAEMTTIEESGIVASATYTTIEAQEKILEGIVVQEQYDGYAGYQAGLDEIYLTTIAENEFTPANPYIIVNPYEIAPQSALIVFETEEAVSVITSIQGKTPETTITHTNKDATTYHEIPLIGLYEGENVVEVLLSNGESYLYSITTQDIPTGYMSEDTIDVLASDVSQLSDGLYVLKNTGRTLLDVNGDVRGYFTIGLATSGCDEVTKDGHLFVSIDEYTNYSAILELDYMGQVYREIYTNDMNTHHEGYLIDDSTLLLGTSYIDLDTYEVTYYNPAFEDIFNYAGGSVEVRSYGDMDALHLNTIEYGGDGYILVSLRNQHAVAKLSYPELEVQWVLSVYDNAYMGWEDVYLTPIGDDFEWFYSQHDVSLVRENEDGTMDITIFDNGVHRGLDIYADYPDDELYSRMVCYRVDEENMTVEQIWDYGEELGNQYLGFVHGSTQYIPESNTYLGNFDAHDAIETGGSEVPRVACYIIELTEDKEVVLEFALGAACYRTEKLLAEVLYSAWEGIGVSTKEYAFIGNGVEPYYNTMWMSSDDAMFDILEISANQDFLNISGWATIESAKDAEITERKLILVHESTGVAYQFEVSTSRWLLRAASATDASLSELNGTAGFTQKRMDISELPDGDYSMTVVSTINGNHYAAELEQVLQIGK